MVRIFSAFSAGRGASRVDVARRRNLLAVSLASLLASVGFTVALPVLPGLLREVASDDLGRLGLWLGLAISVSPLLTAVSGPIWAALGQRYGHKVMIERALVCIGVGITLLAFAQSPLQVVALRAAIGALGGVSIAALAAVTATTPRRDLGPAIGTLQASQTSGAMVGPLLGGALGGLLGMREAFLVSGVVCLLALLLVHWLYREGDLAPVEADARVTPAEQGNTVVGAGMVLAILAAFILQFVEAGFVVLLPLQLERLGATAESLPWAIGLGLSASALAATVTAAAGGRLAGRRSAISLLGGVLILGLVALVPLAVAQTWWQFLGARVLLALAVGAAPTLAYSAAATLAPPERRGTMVGLVSSAGILGWGTSPLVAGALVQIDPSVVLGLDAALLALLALALLAAERGLFEHALRPTRGRGLPTLLPDAGTPVGAGVRNPALLMPRRRERRFSSEEVLAALEGKVHGSRADEILDVVSRPSEWMPTDPRRTFEEVPRYGVRLPTILYLYRRGEDAETIGRRLSLLGGGWATRRTIEIATRLIADRLNR